MAMPNRGGGAPVQQNFQFNRGNQFNPGNQFRSGSQANPGTFNRPRFGGSPSLSGNVTPGFNGSRRFGGSTSQVRGSGQPGSTAGRRFGGPTGQTTVVGGSRQRSFGAQNGPSRAFGSGAAPGGRHFGSGAGVTGRGFGAQRGLRTAPRRSSSGHYTYRGHTYRRFAGGRYRWPHGYGYRRYGVGYRLPRAFWIQDYYVYDYSDYGLGPPPENFQWIRYGPDLLLISLDTGEIAQDIPGVFDDSGDDMGPPPEGDPDQTPGDQGPQDDQN
jgi:Ni/Co efflux regulator RcnB